MTPDDFYRAGMADGERWADADLRDNAPLDAEADALRAEARHWREIATTRNQRAYTLGIARGYRLTITRNQERTAA